MLSEREMWYVCAHSLGMFLQGRGERKNKTSKINYPAAGGEIGGWRLGWGGAGRGRTAGAQGTKGREQQKPHDGGATTGHATPFARPALTHVAASLRHQLTSDGDDNGGGGGGDYGACSGCGDGS